MDIELGKDSMRYFRKRPCFPRGAIGCFGLLLLLTGACSETIHRQGQRPSGVSGEPVGINLSAVNYYATQLPFDNLFLNRDVWLSTDGATWDTDLADTVPMDDDGYPLELPYNGQMLRASTFIPIEQDTFTLSWQGDGDVSVKGHDLKVLDRGERSLRFTVTPSLVDPVFVRIDRSNRDDHVHGIELHGTQSYAATFRSELQGFGVLRFMDWGDTNDSRVVHWSDRTSEQMAQGTDRGVAIEYMIDTANQTHNAMWFNVPHQADDDYIERAAELIAQRLDGQLQVYVEYSNENWNGIFSQVQWEQARGLEAGLGELHDSSSEDEARYWAGLYFSVRRAAYIHDTFRKVLGAQRVVAVLAGQSANPGLNAELLDAYEDEHINPLGGRPDALAVAPYFGEVYRDDVDRDTLTVDRILADAESSIGEQVGDNTRANRKIADAHGVHLIAYEAGQHVLAVGGLENDPDVVDRMIAANRDPRMGDLYREAHQAWLDSGGELVVYFASCQAPSKYGAWGAMEYQGQPPAEAPKWAALRGIVHE